MIQAASRLHDVIGQIIDEAGDVDGEDGDVFEALFDQWGDK